MKRLFLQPLYATALALTFMLSGCEKDKNGEQLIFSIEDDINLGNKVAAETDSIYRAKGQLLEPTSTDPKTQKAYQHLNRILANVLQSDKINYKSEFGYQAKLIKDDSVLNAFATPGGHIYVFSGLIKALDNEDELAGVLGHEIAHADRRHTSKQLQRQYGLSLLLSIVLGENQGQLTNIAAGLATLKFSRDAETEADMYSVEYLNGSQYTCDGAAYFFKKMANESQGGKPPVFLSTHPDDADRIKTITEKAAADNCAHAPGTNTSAYQELKNSL